MLLLNKVFVRAFYQSNAGFFLFFFFVFFGAVQGGSLIAYHLSLMTSILDSSITLAIVLFCWFLYHLKCLGFLFNAIDRADGQFLYNLQALGKQKQWWLYLAIYILLYAPILLYSIVLGVVGIQKGFVQNTIFITLFSSSPFCWQRRYYFIV